jgi:type VI secretion system (T6SS) phospholipase Tle1-like effector
LLSSSRFFLIVFLWYVTQQVKFAPQADPKRPWRTFTIWFGRMSFEDKTLNDNVPYARHALSIDENRAAFVRVGWGDSHSTRPDRDADGFRTFEQYWFAGNHADIGGSYAENESRLSDISLSWMVEAATTVRNGRTNAKRVSRCSPAGCALRGREHSEIFAIGTRLCMIPFTNASPCQVSSILTICNRIDPRGFGRM